jgi:ADP-ribosylglycohydrolase
MPIKKLSIKQYFVKVQSLKKDCIMNNDKLKGLIWGSLLADAYSLGGHWIYDQDEILHSSLNLDTLNAPLSNYHPSKKAGDFTHYGDQSIWLLEYMKQSKVYDPFVYGKRWQKNMNNYNGYKDKASTDSLLNIKSGRSFLASGSGSHDLSIVGRHAPIMFTLTGMDEMLESIKFHTCLTHMSKEALDASKYIAEVTLAMIYNLDVSKTLEERAKFYGESVEAEVAKAFSLKDKSSSVAIKELGASSTVTGGLAATIHLLINYHHDFDALLKENVLAGGDSAARGMVAGMVVGARYGFEAIKPSWIEGLNEYEALTELIG